MQSYRQELVTRIPQQGADNVNELEDMESFLNVYFMSLNGKMRICFSMNHCLQRTSLSLSVLRKVNEALASIVARRRKLNMVSLVFNVVYFRLLFV